jgi:long-chain acyl-CoA synthetase
MTSFKAMLAATLGIIKTLSVSPKDRYLSYLPVAHGMERWLGECVPMYSGEQVFFAESITTFVADLNRCRPTLFLSVPRLWTKFQAGVFTKMPAKKLDLLLSIPLINILIRKKILKGLGLDCVRFAGSGSAPIPAELLHWYNRLGLELLEGYGMTENFNYSHVSKPGKARVGYVGHAYDDVEHRIASDGEIQVKTPGCMMGYFKNEVATKESMTDDGWVRTGDKGEIDPQGRLKITGRTKEIFKTSKGKYVAPSPIENLFIAHPLVELACVGGRAQPQPHAIIQLSEGPKAKASKGASERETMGKTLEEHMVSKVNPSLDGHERLDFIVIVKDDWLPENGFLTPTQKIKRAVIEDTYAPHIEAWYAEKTKVVWYGW